MQANKPICSWFLTKKKLCNQRLSLHLVTKWKECSRDLAPIVNWLFTRWGFWVLCRSDGGDYLQGNPLVDKHHFWKLYNRSNISYLLFSSNLQIGPLSRITTVSPGYCFHQSHINLKGTIVITKTNAIIKLNCLIIEPLRHSKLDQQPERTT